ncbi:MAG: glycosyl hydrolase 115 family protein [Bacteroidales bacterium]|nr:glycosyl hydrolase 115 family protein [Candidatus Cacconaster equifaecalis]
MNCITLLLSAALSLFPLHGSKVLYSSEDAPVVATAAGLFASDVEAVTDGQCSAVTAPAKGNLVIVGTAASPYVAHLAADELKALESRWESYSMKIVRNPFPGVRQAIVIAGSDPRGAAYGLMDLSRQIGVNPWYWWCDVPVRKQAKLYVTPIAGPSKEPSVRYRGIFINDEDWGLRKWAALKDPTGDIGPETYARVCELLLRLKANHLLPAMHSCTSPFYSFAENPEVAAKYGIVIGTSHCEPLLFNNATEWVVERDGQWNYEENRDGVLKAMDSRVEQAAAYENIYTVGMRGIHDRPMEAENEKKKAEITENMIRDQRSILEKHLGRPAQTIPQAFTPYKEVLTTYDYGMNLPDDVTIVWPDDNFGHMKRVSSPLEQQRSGRSGVYYHVSFLGLPDAHLWFSTTSTTLMYSELLKAYRASADRIWILNCGDIKCCEMQVDFFMRLAFDIGAFDFGKAASFPTDFLCEIAGGQFRSDIDASMGVAMRLSASRRPDQMSWQWVMTLKKPYYASAQAETDFSFDNYGEAGRRLADYAAAEAAVDRVMAGVPEDCRAAMFELLEFPVKSAAAVNRSYLGAQQYRLWQRQGRAAAADVKKATELARKEVMDLQNRYWTILDGKWDHIVRFQNLAHMKDKNQFKPSPALSKTPCVGVSAHVGEFSSLTRRSGLIEVYAKSSVPAEWRAGTSGDWIRLSSRSGRTAGVDSVTVDIDWARVPEGRTLSGYVCISGEESKEYVIVKAVNPSDEIAPGTFVEDDGVVSIPAAEYTRLGACDSIQVRKLGGIGIEGSALMMGDADGSLHDYRTDRSPHAEYDFWCSDAGSVDVYVYLVPQFPLYKDMDFKIYNGSNTGIRYGVMIDSLAPRMEPEMNMVEFGENHKIPILHECFINKGTLCIDAPGMHTLKLICGTEGVMFQKIVLDFGGLTRSWNGPETTIKN